MTHERVFWGDEDDPGAFMSDVAFQQKGRFIEQHGPVVWRFRDHLHRRQQDMFAVTDLSFAGLKGSCSASLRYAGSIHIVSSQGVARREPLLQSVIRTG